MVISLFALVVSILLLAFGHAQGVGGLGSAIGDAVDAVNADIVPKMLQFMGLLVSVALGWAIVRVIRG